ncbi:hypothetical protein PT520_09550 [Aliarcobacter butzleri]|uniref:Uncharacterized protein n=1 Tax=Aliarcobacter butzleri TaxID=28197 RepID=A0AAW6VPM3_9BACT|nr:hypothetical protein [Aliarcobacter butzleri]MDK2062760.1 hypothetical protein [Aliarcobacter butzleri]
MITDKEIQRVIKKGSSLDWIKKHHPEHYKTLQLGAYLIKNNINSLEELETLINIKDKLLNK